ncbi:MAG: GYF domain-containing protein [Planctomycetota bacterium]
MADAQWYVGIAGEQKGPFPEEEVKAMILRRELLARNYVWQEGMENWAPVAEVDAFTQTLQEAPPAPTAPVPGARFLTTFYARLLAILRDPDEGLNKVVAERPVGFALCWMALGVLVFALLGLSARGNWVPGLQVLYVPAATGLAAFAKGLFLGIVLYLIWFGAIMAAVGPFLKTQADWRDGFTVLGISSIPTATVGLVIWLLLFIPSPLFAALVLVIFGAVALPVKVLLFYRALRRITGASRRAVLYAVPAIYLAANLVYGLLILVMS